MIPNSIGLFGFVGSLGILSSISKKKRTDRDRLIDLDKAEAAYISKINNPTYIAAQEKRERRRMKRSGVIKKAA